MQSGEDYSLVLVHGAASGPRVFDHWTEVLDGIGIIAVDLHEGRDVATASMVDYANVVVGAAERSSRPLALCGWSMGGLVAMMAAGELRPGRLVLLEPSPPGQVAGFDGDVVPAAGVFDGERTYGPFPTGIPSRPESSLARAERKRGISIPELPCSTLVVSSAEFEVERGVGIASRYGCEHLHFGELDHWGLVMDQQVPSAILQWLRKKG